jgi:hypothetical protein
MEYGIKKVCLNWSLVAEGCLDSEDADIHSEEEFRSLSGG